MRGVEVVVRRVPALDRAAIISEPVLPLFLMILSLFKLMALTIMLIGILGTSVASGNKKIEIFPSKDVFIIAELKFPESPMSNMVAAFVM